MKHRVLKTLLVAAATVLAVGQTGAQTNLVKNGDFSTQSDWSNSSLLSQTGNQTVVSEGIVDNTFKLLLYVNVHPLAELPIIPPPLSQVIPVQPNHTYNLSFQSSGFQSDQRTGVVTFIAPPPWQVSFAGQTKNSNVTDPINQSVWPWVPNSMNFTVGNVTSALLSFTTTLGSVFSLLQPGCVPCQVTEQLTQLSNISLTDVTPAAAPLLKVQKALGTGGRIDNADQFKVSILNAATSAVLNSANTGGSGSTVTGGLASISGDTATTYKLAEEMATGSKSVIGQYSAALACSNSNSSGTQIPASIQLGQNFPLLKTGDDISCTITNTPVPPAAATLQVRQSVLSPVPANLAPPFTFQYIGSNGWGTRSLSNAALNQTVSTSAIALGATNTLTTLSTTLPDSRWFVASFACTDQNAPGSGNPTGTLVKSTSPSVTIPASLVRPGSALRCSMLLGHVTP